jgi:hypothetical protein
MMLVAASTRAQDTTFADEGRTYISLVIGGFLPMRESFRINYSTEFAGLPLEVAALVQFPISERSSPGVGVRFLRRVANFVKNTEIQSLQLEPFFRYYLDPVRRNVDSESDDLELGLYTGISGQLARSAVSGEIEETIDGQNLRRRQVSKYYFGLGAGFDLGLTYPLGPRSAIDAGVHVSAYFNDPVSQGGLGNIGGVSFNAAYRFGF